MSTSFCESTHREAQKDGSEKLQPRMMKKDRIRKRLTTVLTALITDERNNAVFCGGGVIANCKLKRVYIAGNLSGGSLKIMLLN